MLKLKPLAPAALIAAACFLSPPLVAQQAAPAAAKIALMDGDAPGAYRAAGAVSAEVQGATATLPKQKLDDQLRAEAAKLGADAVIMVTYQMTSSAHRASGVAIRFTAAPAAPVVVAPVAPAIAPAVVTPPVVAAAPAAAAAPPVVAAAPAVASPAPIAPVAVAAPLSAAVHATTPEMVVLIERDLVERRYVRLGSVSVVTHQKAMFTKTPPMTQLQDALRAEALKKGADAVIEVKYQMTNAAFSKKGNTATGIAVRFE